VFKQIKIKKPAPACCTGNAPYPGSRAQTCYEWVVLADRYALGYSFKSKIYFIIIDVWLQWVSATGYLLSAAFKHVCNWS